MMKSPNFLKKYGYSLFIKTKGIWEYRVSAVVAAVYVLT